MLPRALKLRFDRRMTVYRHVGLRPDVFIRFVQEYHAGIDARQQWPTSQFEKSAKMHLMKLDRKVRAAGGGATSLYEIVEADCDEIRRHLLTL